MAAGAIIRLNIDGTADSLATVEEGGGAFEEGSLPDEERFDGDSVVGAGGGEITCPHAGLEDADAATAEAA